MPTIFTHPAVAIALRPRHLLVASLLTILPDIDVVAFGLGIPYGSTFGHRGFTHSILLPPSRRRSQLSHCAPTAAPSRSFSFAPCRTASSTP